MKSNIAKRKRAISKDRDARLHRVEAWLFGAAVRDDTPFQHELLDLSKRQFRLLRIHKSTSNSDTISCTVEIHERPPEQGFLRTAYRALSYAWGPPAPTRQILLNRKPFEVRENLWWFLHYTASGHLPYAEPETLLWIDQLCINQTHTDERNHQVKAMSEIFSRAKGVVIWLGLDDEEVKLAVDVLREGYFEVVSHNGRPGADKDLTVESFVKLMSRPYWNRLWVQQEILLAAEKTVVIGRQQFGWAELRDLYDRLPLYYHTAERSLAIWKHQFDWDEPEDIYGRPPLDNHNMGINADTEHIPGWNAILHLRQSLFTYSKAFEDMTMLELVARFGRCDCQDKRDKVYGLMGISHRTKRLPVDYRLSPAEVFWRMWEDPLNQGGHIHEVFYSLSEALGRSYDSLILVGLAMGVTGQEPECSGRAGQHFREAFKVDAVESFQEALLGREQPFHQTGRGDCIQVAEVPRSLHQGLPTFPKQVSHPIADEGGETTT
jgi:hypothetical protein